MHCFSEQMKWIRSCYILKSVQKSVKLHFAISTLLLKICFNQLEFENIESNMPLHQMCQTAGMLVKIIIYFNRAKSIEWMTGQRGALITKIYRSTWHAAPNKRHNRYKPRVMAYVSQLDMQFCALHPRSTRRQEEGERGKRGKTEQEPVVLRPA